MRRLLELPSTSLPELVPLEDLGDINLGTLFEARKNWTLGPLEQLALLALARGRRARKVLEIGTFEGSTTAIFAEAVGPEGSVVTVDFPPEDLAKYDLPPGFTSDDVGRVYRNSDISDRVQQLRIDSTKLSPESLGSGFDLVFIDAFHDYPHGRSDAELALSVVDKSGLIIFDDFDPHWSGLVLAVTDVAAGRDLRVITGTRLALLFP